jgi:hypothetical protein
MDPLPDMKKEDVLPYIDVLTQVKESGLLERFDVDILARLQDVKSACAFFRGIGTSFGHRSCKPLPV